ncbi:helicase HerA-like domain-containing protein [Streptomyces sp. NPDC050844]|uniref:helicase HerA-like domain-containing protein n=1 Tax=Streptomyces sp. NPDC050844 TaxID=3155790 RepID=UPI003400CDD0
MAQEALEIVSGYAFAGPALDLGALLWGGRCLADAQIRIPLSMLNRHGLVAGATGTGKTKTLQLNQTQEQSLGLIFHYADQKGLELVDLKDLRAVVTFVTSDEGKPELKGIGGLSTATAGVILRALTAFEAFTPDDQKALIEETLTSMGTGEAVITVMSEKGAPTPVAVKAAEPAEKPKQAKGPGSPDPWWIRWSAAGCSSPWRAAPPLRGGSFPPTNPITLQGNRGWAGKACSWRRGRGVPDRATCRRPSPRP